MARQCPPPCPNLHDKVGHPQPGRSRGHVPSSHGALGRPKAAAHGSGPSDVGTQWFKTTGKPARLEEMNDQNFTSPSWVTPKLQGEGTPLSSGASEAGHGSSGELGRAGRDHPDHRQLPGAPSSSGGGRNVHPPSAPPLKAVPHSV